MSLLSPELSDLMTIVSFILSIFAILLSIPYIRKFCRWFYLKLTVRDFFFILGPDQVGKTTLVSFLRHTPAPEDWNRTFYNDYGVLSFDINGKNNDFLYSSKIIDVGGEHKEFWENVIKSENPNGIIYIVDNSKRPDLHDDLEYIYNIYSDLKRVWKPKEIRLKTLMIVINKADLWDAPINNRDTIISNCKTTLTPITEKFTNSFQNVEVFYEWTAFKKFQYYDQNCDILLKFANSIIRKI
jgi:signal recognition particle receptor subunit beta